MTITDEKRGRELQVCFFAGGRGSDTVTWLERLAGALCCDMRVAQVTRSHSLFYFSVLFSLSETAYADSLKIYLGTDAVVCSN